MPGPFDHNPNLNPNWTPRMARRLYACARCGAEQSATTNHTGTVPAMRCAGTCRQILMPHTAQELVLPHTGPHRYVREID